jgi:hypothetical protein
LGAASPALTAVLALMLLVPGIARAQVANERRVSIDAGITVERLVSEYRFENASSFDTAALVPHVFVQRYESTQPWLVVRARYPVGGRMGETTAGYAPERVAFASDVDTFFQPDGDVVTSGTSGEARLRSFAIDQRIEVGRTHGWLFDGQLRYTQRRADFLPADRVVTHTRPPSETHEFVTTREFTTSHEMRVGMSVAIAGDASGGWRVEAVGAGWPVVGGRLVTELPDKYPGRDIVFGALGFGGEARVTLVRPIGSAMVTVTVHATIVRPYDDASSLRQHTLGAGVTLGFGGRR